MNINMRMNKNNTQIIHNAVNKMHKGELEVNDIFIKHSNFSKNLANYVRSNLLQLN